MTKKWVRYFIIFFLLGGILAFTFSILPVHRESETTTIESSNLTKGNFSGFPLAVCHNEQWGRTDGTPGVTAPVRVCDDTSILFDSMVGFSISFVSILVIYMLGRMRNE